MGERALRPFWIHQLVEYIIGLALIGQGMQDPQPLVPTAAGVLVLVNAAAVRGRRSDGRRRAAAADRGSV